MDFNGNNDFGVSVGNCSRLLHAYSLMGDLGVVGAWLVLVGVVVVAIGVAVGSVLLTRRIVDTRPEHNSILSPFLTVVGLVYGAVLGFTVVVGWQQYLTAQTNVSNEAATLTTLYRQTVAIPQPEQSSDARTAAPVRHRHAGT